MKQIWKASRRVSDILTNQSLNSGELTARGSTPSSRMTSAVPGKLGSYLQTFIFQASRPCRSEQESLWLSKPSATVIRRIIRYHSRARNKAKGGYTPLHVSSKVLVFETVTSFIPGPSSRPLPPFYRVSSIVILGTRTIQLQHHSWQEQNLCPVRSSLIRSSFTERLPVSFY
jgi:hypothetical protein